MLTDEDAVRDSVDASKEMRLFTTEGNEDEDEDESVEGEGRHKRRDAAVLLSTTAFSNSRNTADHRQVRKATKTGVRKLKITTRTKG